MNRHTQRPVRRGYLSTWFSLSLMFIFMLGLLVLTAILALNTVSNVKAMLTPEPVRVK